MRFSYAKRSLSEDDLRWLDEISHGNHVGLVATVPSGCEELIIGEGSYAVLGRTAEIGFTVAEAWQRGGIASRLLQHLASIARDQGVGEFEAYVLQENEPMLAVFPHSGLPMTTQDAEGVLHVTFCSIRQRHSCFRKCSSALREEELNGHDTHTRHHRRYNASAASSK